MSPTELAILSFRIWDEWREYGEWTETALEDFALQYGVSVTDWPAVHTHIHTCIIPRMAHATPGRRD